MNPVAGLTNPAGLLLDHTGGRRCGVDRQHGEVGYADMLGMVTQYAGRLAAAGVRPGCRAAVVSDDSIAAITAVLGLWWYGCVPILLHPMLRDAEVGFVLRDSEAEFAELNVGPERRAALRAPEADEATPSAPCDPKSSPRTSATFPRSRNTLAGSSPKPSARQSSHAK